MKSCPVLDYEAKEEPSDEERLRKAELVDSRAGCEENWEESSFRQTNRAGGQVEKYVRGVTSTEEVTPAREVPKTGGKMTTEQAKSHKTDSRRHLEIACFDAKSVLLADQSGASRTEFCTDRASGGITPLRTEILDILPLLQNPTHIMIRPRGGDFVYSDAEFEQMKHDVRAIKAAPGPGRLGGFAFGILDSDGRVDVARNFQLVELARPLSCTFHRAFDETRDLGEAMEDIISCGFETVLTSGGAADAVSGADILEELVAKANERIVVMPGGGVRSSNIELLITKTKAAWYHSSAFAGDEISVEEVALLIKLLKSAQ